MADKARKLIGAFGGRLYPWPATVRAAQERNAALAARLTDSHASQTGYRRFLDAEVHSLMSGGLEGGPRLAQWRRALAVERSVFTTLNLFETTEHTLQCACWYPAKAAEGVRAVLAQETPRHAAAAMLLTETTVLHADPHGHGNPPTFIRTNGLTKMVQQVVDTYGTPRYKEANPMVPSLVTFPFLFGVMFGDVGHGLLLFLFGLTLLRMGEKVKKLGGEYGETFYDARYLLTAMGFFALYAGLLYNDFLSLALNLFESRYEEGAANSRGVEMLPLFDVTNSGAEDLSTTWPYITDPPTEAPPLAFDGPYPFGLDPVWHGAANELVFVNSLKMKLSVVLGVAQMIGGLLLRFGNSIHEGNMVDFFCECCPMMVFMICFFGFMDYMILYKWVTPMADPPSIINSLIAMGMWQTDSAPMFGHALPKMLMA